MKHSMAGSNVKIIIELKKFLEDISKDFSKREKYIVSIQDFSRNRILNFQTMVLLLINVLKRSLNVELMSFFEYFSVNTLCTKQAFSKQRRKLKALFFHDWNHVLTAGFYTHYPYARWKDFKLLAVDGSSVLLPDTEKIRSAYGCTVNQTGQGSPVARICVLYDVLNQLVIKGLLHPYAVSEESVVLEVIREDNLSESLLLFDRGYLSYWLIHQLLEGDTHFVMRAASNANNTVKAFLASKETDITVSIYPPYPSLKKLRDMGVAISKETPVKIRLVKVLLNTGEKEVLITNLYDTALYTQEDLKQVYHLRWGIETCYGYIKDELQLGVCSGISPLCIEQDLAVNLFLFNLQSIIEKQCEPYINTVSCKRKYQYKVNKNVSWASLKYRVVKLFIEEEPPDILRELEILFCRYVEPVRPGRKYPRINKRKPNSKHYTLTNYKRAI
jgi:hypothetical protein